MVEQIEILIHESKVRLDNDYYNFALEELRLIYTVEIHSMQNKKLVEKYRIALIEKVNEIFALLQDMSLKDLTSEEKINDKCPPDCYYAFSKLSDAVWGNGYSGLVDFHPVSFPDYFRVVDLRNGKQVDDGYRAIHLYYQRDSLAYPIEVQL